MHAMLSEELDRARLALELAQDRIAELSKSQLGLMGTLGKVVELATTDPLTGLANRRRFMEELKAKFEAATAQSQPLSVVMLDIDSFKSYNDSFGHLAGDQVLWVVAKLLARNTRGDHLVARHGGEELAVLLPATDVPEALEIAERLRFAIATHPWPDRPVTASFGVSTRDRTTGSPAALLEEADRALYCSKSRGRDRVTHHRELEDAVSLGGRAGSPGPRPEPPEIRFQPASSSAPALLERPSMTNATLNWPNPDALRVRPRMDEPAWDALERFIQALQGRQATDLPEVLSAIREGIEAEVVFLCNDQTGEVLGEVGDHVPFPQWHHQLVRRLARELPSGGLWTPSEGSRSASASAVPEPSAVVLLPVKDPRSSWLVAVQFREDRGFSAADLRVARVIWQLQGDHRRHDRAQDKLKETLFGIVRCLSAAIDAKDPYTCGHSERVARIAVRLGEEMGLPKGAVSDLYLAGLLHDLGKIGIRDAVLCKEGPLTPEEFLHIQEHPVTGERIIANVTRLAYLRPGIRGHHERFDGKGYPDGLAGEVIPQMARILAVADSCDAMMSVRRYRAALSEPRIEQIFREGAGTQWDPRIVEHFLNCRHDLFAVIQRGLGQSVYFAVERAVGGETMTGGGNSIVRKGQPISRTR
jgi:diguanylate cyclase (GGDEF)-like protein